MKLLFDQNLSPRLCDRLRDIRTDPVHVRTVGLAAADDSAIWRRRHPDVGDQARPRPAAERTIRPSGGGAIPTDPDALEPLARRLTTA